MSIDQRKKKEMQIGDHMSDVAMLMKLAREYRESLKDFVSLEGRFLESKIDEIVKDAPIVIKYTDPKTQKEITEIKSFDDFLNMALVTTYSSDEDSTEDLYDAIFDLRECISELRQKPWIRAEKPERVTAIVATKIRRLLNAIGLAERSHVHFGMSRFATAVEVLSNKRSIPVDGKVMVAIKHPSEEEGDWGGDYSEGDADGGTQG